MAQDVNLGGTIYISSKAAAEKTGYTQDYIGQLARSGQIEAKRISGMWYIFEESLRNYKAKADQFVPTPPEGFKPGHEADVAVSFDGKDYVSANRAAKLTGYNQDYIGQLARSGQILSRQVGRRWYVDRESLLSHKKAKDDLLAAVQVESVGLAKPEEAKNQHEMPVEQASEEPITHFEYVQEKVPLIPTVKKEEPLAYEKTEPMPEFPRRKVAEVTFVEYRPETALSQPITIRKPLPEPGHGPSWAATSSRVTAPTPVLSLDDALDPPKLKQEQVNIPIRVLAPQRVIEELYHADIREDIRPRVSYRKMKKGGVFAIAGLAVAAAVGTIAYVGSSLGFINLDGFISLPQKAQNGAVANSVIKDGSKNAWEIILNLVSKELVYRRE